MIRKTILMAGVVALAAATVQAQDPRVEISGTAGWDVQRRGGREHGRQRSGRGDLRLDRPQGRLLVGRPARLQRDPQRRGGLPVQPAVDQVRAGRDDQRRPRRRERLQLPRLLRLQLRRLGRQGAAVRPRRARGDAVRLGVRDRRRRDPGLGGEHAVLQHLGSRREAVPSPKFGIRLEARWTPTYIKSDSEGWWCHPYWVNPVGSDAQYANQFELSGGITLRF